MLPLAVSVSVWIPLLLGLRVPGFRFIWLLGLIMLPVEVFYRLYYGGPVSAGILLSILQTHRAELSELLGAHPLYVALAVLYLAALLFLFRRVFDLLESKVRAWTHGLCVAWVVAAGIIGASSGIQYARSADLADVIEDGKDALKATFPIDMLNAAAINARGAYVTHRSRQSRAQFAFADVRRVPSETASPPVFVVMIGETARSANWSLYGYERDTTPGLDAIRSDLVAFTNAFSNANLTVYSIPLTLTRATPSSWERWAMEKSLVTLLNQAGYETYWLSNQEKYGTNENAVSAIAAEARHVSFINRTGADLDAGLLNTLDEALARPVAAPGAVIFLHIMGSHFNYRDRYPPGDAIFSKGTGLSGARATLGAQKKRVVDEYDNSIRYTDHIIAEVIGRLRRPGGVSALIYFSDHGERLFDGRRTDGELGHGFAAPDSFELRVPFVLWMSESYRRQHPREHDNAAAHMNCLTVLDDVFETVADLAGVRFSGFDSRRSLLAPDYAVPDRVDVLLPDKRPETFDYHGYLREPTDGSSPPCAQSADIGADLRRSEPPHAQ